MNSLFLDLSELTLAELLSSLCPNPGYRDLREIRTLVSSLENQLGRSLWPDLQEKLPLPKGGFVQKLYGWIDKGPVELLNWWDQRGFKWGHLRPLALLAAEQDRPWVRALAALSPTLQQGQKILEMAVELELMGESPKVLAPSQGEDLSGWEKRLHELRYPESQRRMQEQLTQLEKIIWPPGVSGRWIRQGDRMALEVRLLAKSEEEFKKLSGRLASLSSGEGPQLWT